MKYLLPIAVRQSDSDKGEKWHEGGWEVSPGWSNIVNIPIIELQEFQRSIFLHQRIPSSCKSVPFWCFASFPSTPSLWETIISFAKSQSLRKSTASNDPAAIGLFLALLTETVENKTFWKRSGDPSTISFEKLGSDEKQEISCVAVTLIFSSEFLKPLGFSVSLYA